MTEQRCGWEVKNGWGEWVFYEMLALALANMQQHDGALIRLAYFDPENKPKDGEPRNANAPAS